MISTYMVERVEECLKLRRVTDDPLVLVVLSVLFLLVFVGLSTALHFDNCCVGLDKLSDTSTALASSLGAVLAPG